MLTYEIRKPTKLTPLVEKMQNILHLRKPQQQQWPNTSPFPKTGQERYMGKLEFAKWIEELKKELKKGDFMTLATNVYVPERIPFPLFRIADIQEIHWNAPIGSVHEEPRALYCYSVRSPTVQMQYEPKVLRKLNDEEFKLVNTSDYKAG